MKCAMELCASWTGDDWTCPCAIFDIAPADRPIVRELEKTEQEPWIDDEDY